MTDFFTETTETTPTRAQTMSNDDTDKWVRRLNALADELDGDAAMMHPSAWHVALEGKIAKWKKLAKQGGDHAEV